MGLLKRQLCTKSNLLWFPCDTTLCIKMEIKSSCSSTVIMESVATSTLVWCRPATKHDIHKLQNSPLVLICPPWSGTRQNAEKSISDPSHPGRNLFQLLPSGRDFSRMSFNHRTAFTLMNRCCCAELQGLPFYI